MALVIVSSTRYFKLVGTSFNVIVLEDAKGYQHSMYTSVSISNKKFQQIWQNFKRFKYDL